MDQKMLIISDEGSQSFWQALTGEIKETIGPLRLILDEEVPAKGFKQTYDPIVMDVSDPENLHRMIPGIHEAMPESRIIIVTSSPTWKETREVLRLGAATLVRKSSNPEDMLAELREVKS
jgi:DNA-binding NarL/FixJ family response regulator